MTDLPSRLRLKARADDLNALETQPAGRLKTICGVCEREWPTDSGQQICPECGNDGEIEGHVIRDDGADMEPTRDELKQAMTDLLVNCSCEFNDCDYHHRARNLLGLSHDPDIARQQVTAGAVGRAETASRLAADSKVIEVEAEPPIDTYTPLLWASMTDCQQYGEYVRLREKLAPKTSAPPVTERRAP